MNEQMLEQRSEESLSLDLDVSDEALEAAAGGVNELAGPFPSIGPNYRC